MTVRTGSSAKAFALSKVGSHVVPGYCLVFTRTCFNIAAKYPSAISAWNNAKKRHTDKPPSGAVVPVFFHSASQYRHVAIALGDGRVVTVNGTNVQTYSSIDALARSWNAPYIGWSEDLNGVTVYTKPKPKPARQYTNVTALQRALGASPDNVFGPDSSKRLNAVRSASDWKGQKFPYGKKYTQAVVGTHIDGDWGKNSAARHTLMVRAIQKAVGVKVDGRYGPITDAAVRKQVSGARKS